MTVLQTKRLVLRFVAVADAEFILDLMNQPSWLRYIGDRNVRSLDDARGYIRDRFIRSYDEFGFGLYLTQLRADATPIGICGLIKRPELEDVDIGFALHPAFWGQGYAFEAASAVLEFGKQQLEIERIVAITMPDNEKSIRLLEKLGLTFESMVRLSADGPENELYAG